MKKISKKLVVGITLGAALLGVGFSNLSAQAAEKQTTAQSDSNYSCCPPPMYQHHFERERHHREHMTHEDLAKKMTCDYLAEDTALKLLNDGYNPRDIRIAAKLSNVTGKDIKSVLNMKKINNSWQDVAEKLNVNWSDVRPDKKDWGKVKIQPADEPIDPDMMVEPNADAQK